MIPYSFREKPLLARAPLLVALVAALLWAACRDRAPGAAVLPAVKREAFGAAWTDREVQVVGLGDSITAGFGASPGRSYFDLLTRGDPDDAEDMRGLCLAPVLPRMKAVNLSLSGSTSIEHLEHQVARMPAFPAGTLGVIVMTTGGNDVIHDYGRRPPRDGAMYGASLAQARPWIRAYETRLWRMIDEIELRFPGGCHVFLANIYDPTDGVGDIERAGLALPRWKDGLAVLAEMNAVVERCARIRESVHLVDIRGTFLGHGIHCRDRGNPHYRDGDESYWYHDNLEDPNDTGYDAIRRLYLARMADVLAPEASGERSQTSAYITAWRATGR